MGVDALPAPVYEFGPFRVDAQERLLRRGATIIPLTPKAIDTLIALVDARGQLVSKETLMDRLWPGTFVEEANLSNQISLLRKALGDSTAAPRYIETVPKRGYRFAATVVESFPRALDPALVVPITPARRWLPAPAAAVAVVILVVAAGTWLRMREAGATAAPPSITRLTTTGQVRHAATSCGPGGKRGAPKTGSEWGGRPPCTSSALPSVSS